MGGQLKNLSVFTHTSINSGGQTFTVRKNGIDTDLTCTIGAIGSTCSDTSHIVSFAALDSITFKSLATHGNSTAPAFHAVAEIDDGSGNPYDAVVSWGGAALGLPLNGRYCGPGLDVGTDTGCNTVHPAAAAF